MIEGRIENEMTGREGQGRTGKDREGQGGTGREMSLVLSL